MKIAVLKGSLWSKISGIKGHSHELFLVSSRLKVERTRDSSKLTQAQTSVECQNYQNFQLRFLPQNSIQNFTHIHFLYFYTLYFYNVIYIVVIFSSINFIRTFNIVIPGHYVFVLLFFLSRSLVEHIAFIYLLFCRLFLSVAIIFVVNNLINFTIIFKLLLTR